MGLGICAVNCNFKRYPSRWLCSDRGGNANRAWRFSGVLHLRCHRTSIVENLSLLKRLSFDSCYRLFRVSVSCLNRWARDMNYISC